MPVKLNVDVPKIIPFKTPLFTTFPFISRFFPEVMYLSLAVVIMRLFAEISQFVLPINSRPVPAGLLRMMLPS